MLHAGLDLSCKRLDYCLLGAQGDRVEIGAAPPDGDEFAPLARGVEQRHGPGLPVVSALIVNRSSSEST